MDDRKKNPPEQVPLEIALGNWSHWDYVEPWDLPPTPPRKKRKPRKPSLAKAIRTARKQGVDLMVAPDGTLVLRCSQPGNGAMIETNEWDTVLSHGAH